MARRWGRRVVTSGGRFLGSGFLIALLGCNAATRPSIRFPANRAAEEEVIRRLDGDWVQAAQTKQVDAWMTFYADDAVVLPPNEKVAKDKDSIRKSVGELLGLPGLSLTWQPTKVEVAGSGDLAYLYGAYDLTMNDAKGVPTTDYGKIVEIWKKQANGTWKCVVDTWNSDLPVAPSIATIVEK